MMIAVFPASRIALSLGSIAELHLAGPAIRARLPGAPFSTFPAVAPVPSPRALPCLRGGGRPATGMGLGAATRGGCGHGRAILEGRT